MSSALLLLSLLPGAHLDQRLDREDARTVAVGHMLVISEFYPRALCRDEYVSIACLSGSDVNLRNWSITDGEGTLRFTDDTLISRAESLTLSMNSSSFMTAFDRMPDYALDLPEMRGVSKSGTFALADGGDSLSLLDSVGHVVDFVGYGDAHETSTEWQGAMLPNLRQGEIARRAESNGLPRDTDCSSDWMTFREHKYGYTDFEPFISTLPAGKLTAFTSPDCSLDAVLGAVESAVRRVRICSYEFSSLALTRSLLNALDRGTAIEILVDGSPAGGMDDRQVQCLSVLSSHGANVFAVNGNLSLRIVQHCGAIHAKYIVVDASISLILSENFVESGIPEDRVFANRGWGVRLDDAGTAEFLSNVFDSDARRSRADLRDWLDDPRFVRDAVLPGARLSNHTQGLLGPFTTTDIAGVTILPSPDVSSVMPYLRPILSRSSHIVVEQFQVDLRWQDRWTGREAMSPLVGDIVSGMRRGAEVQMLMDSSWFNTARNDEIAEVLASTAKNESLDGSFKVMDAGGPISVVHNKGVILDRKFTIVSSNNWCRASFASNREMAALIDSPEVAAYFGRAFALDWEPDIVSPNASAGPDIDIVVGETAILDGSASSDDRAIVDWRWDLDSDGSADTNGRKVSHIWYAEGEYRVTLYVEDAWGNRATDVAVIRVSPANSGNQGGMLEMHASGVAGAIATGLISASIGSLLAKWRLSRSRKFNHPGSD